MLRKAAGMTQEQLAEKGGIAPQYLSRLETAHQIPSLDTVVDLADALNVAAFVLLADPEEDTRVEIIGGVTGRFGTLSEEDIAFLESHISGLLAYLKKVRYKH